MIPEKVEHIGGDTCNPQFEYYGYMGRLTDRIWEALPVRGILILHLETNKHSFLNIDRSPAKFNDLEAEQLIKGLTQTEAVKISVSEWVNLISFTEDE